MQELNAPLASSTTLQESENENLLLTVIWVDANVMVKKE